MVGELFINNKDAQKEYGISFGADSFTVLLTPAPLKPYIEDKSALSHGKQVLNDERNAPKLDERDMQLTFNLKANNLTQFLQRYAKFTEVLSLGKVDIRTKYQPDVTYHCKYISCVQFSQYNGRLAKFILKLNEPNPNNRVTQ